MAGNHNADTVVAIGSTHRPDGFYIGQPFAKFKVTDGTAIGDIKQFFPDRLLKSCTYLFYIKTERFSFAFKIFIQLFDAGFYNGGGIAVPGTSTPSGASIGTTGVSGLTDFDSKKTLLATWFFTEL